MRLAVPALEFGGAIEPEVGAKIDEGDARRDHLVGKPLRFPMGQGGKDQVAAVQQRGFPCGKGHVRIGQCQVRVHRRYRLAGIGRTESDADLHLRVLDDEAH